MVKIHELAFSGFYFEFNCVEFEFELDSNSNSNYDKSFTQILFQSLNRLLGRQLPQTARWPI
jgi:hypothetical protein